MTNYICALPQELIRIKDVTEEDAHKIRAVWKAGNMDDLAGIMGGSIVDDYLRPFYNLPTVREVKREMVDLIIGTCGVEYLGRDRRTRNDIYYCNAGDTYAITILFSRYQLFVGCWGDLVEKNRVHRNY